MEPFTFIPPVVESENNQINNLMKYIQQLQKEKKVLQGRIMDLTNENEELNEGMTEIQRLNRYNYIEAKRLEENASKLKRKYDRLVRTETERKRLA
jgi:predicted nuclease with TOPRIM domain